MRAFVSPRVSLSLPEGRLEDLFLAFGAKLPSHERKNPLELARLLWGIDVSPALFAALDDLQALASEDGLFAIGDAAADLKRKFPKGVTGNARAPYVLGLPATDPSAVALRERIFLGIGRTAPPLSWSERIAAKARTVPLLEEALPAFRTALGDDVKELFVGQDDSGALRLAVLRALPAEEVVVGTTRGAERVSVSRIGCDMLRIDAESDRLSIDAESRRGAARYQRIVALEFFGDKGYFKSRPAFTLKPLERLGSVGLQSAKLPDGVMRVRVVEMGWSDGVHAYRTAKGSNALSVYEGQGGPAGGYIAHVVLRLDLRGETRPIDVTIRLPHRIGIREERYESIVRATLRALGILSPGLLPDDAWTLAPFIHPEWRWDGVLGAGASARMQALGLVMRVRTRLAGGSDGRRFGWSHITFPLTSDPGNFYAVADDPALPSRTVDGSEVVMWQLRVDRVAERLREELQLEPPPTTEATIESHAQFVELGVKRGPTSAFRIFAVLRSPGGSQQSEVAHRIRKQSKAEVPIVLLPKGRTLGGILAEVPLDSAQLLGVDPCAADVFSAIESTLGVTGLVEPWRLVKPGVRLLFIEEGARAWFDGVPVSFSAKEWTFALSLAKSPSGTLEPHELEAGLFRDSRVGMARNVAVRLRKRVREAFEAAGRPLAKGDENIIEFAPPRTWRLTVPFEVR